MFTGNSVKYQRKSEELTLPPFENFLRKVQKKGERTIQDRRTNILQAKLHVLECYCNFFLLKSVSRKSGTSNCDNDRHAKHRKEKCVWKVERESQFSEEIELQSECNGH